ncbi:hypothetical protein AgCh_027883 [Apium graveolens]
MHISTFVLLWVQAGKMWIEMERVDEGELERTAVLKAICAGFQETTDPPICLSGDTDSELAAADLLKSGSGVRFTQTNILFYRFIIFVMSSALSLWSILDAHKLTGPNLAVCFHCNKLGHWKRNCKIYLAELKKKGSETTASDSGMFMIEVNMSLGQISTWVLDTACGSHICNSLQGLKGSRTL